MLDHTGILLYILIIYTSISYIRANTSRLARTLTKYNKNYLKVNILSFDNHAYICLVNL